MTLRPKRKSKKVYKRPLLEQKYQTAPTDLITYLAAFRKFQAIPAAVVGEALHIVDTTRRENKESPTSLLEAQIFADTIGAKISVIIECHGLKIECPLYLEVNNEGKTTES